MLKQLKIFASICRLHIVAIAALGNFTFTWLLVDRYAFGLPLLCALDWFLVNLLNRVVDLKEDRENAIVGTALVGRHRRAILRSGFAVLFSSLVLQLLLH